MIDTANLVVQQAQETGTKATAEISSGLKIVNIAGDRANDTGALQSEIQIVELKVRLHAGSPSIAISGLVIEITDGNVSVNLAYKDVTSNFAAEANSTHYTTEAIRDPDGSWGTSRFISSATLVKIYINASAAGLELDPQTKVIMKMIPRQGVVTYEEFITPDSYGSDRYIMMT
jgi:flagellin FlaB